MRRPCKLLLVSISTRYIPNAYANSSGALWSKGGKKESCWLKKFASLPGSCRQKSNLNTDTHTHTCYILQARRGVIWWNEKQEWLVGGAIAPMILMYIHSRMTVSTSSSSPWVREEKRRTWLLTSYLLCSRLRRRRKSGKLERKFLLEWLVHFPLNIKFAPVFRVFGSAETFIFRSLRQ